jgi:hypothetical protein
MTQVFHQVKIRLVKPAYTVHPAPALRGNQLQTSPIPRYKSLEGERFSFLNLEHPFAGWDFTGNGMLWAYNQNYFDWLNQEGMTAEEGCGWIDRFIREVLERPAKPVASLDPYPIALRSINWIKFFCRYPECATQARTDALYSQVLLLEKKLEYHLLANHLLEDAFALYVSAAYFQDDRLMKRAYGLLLAQLAEQILPDGAHFEQSPMYHCILLDRLLDCINIRPTEELRGYAALMLGHLASIVWADGGIPLLDDAAYGIAPTAEQLFGYARQLGLQWAAVPMADCGYRRMRAAALEAIVDVGNVTATYQPGHTHADSLNYELRVAGKPVVVDTGISTYNKDARRQLERSSAAHNVVVVDGMDSSEVWGGFRVGRRAKVEILHSNPNEVVARHNGFGGFCTRRFAMTETAFVVEDWFEGEAVSYVHLAEGVAPERVVAEGAKDVRIRPWKYATEYNRFLDGTVVEILFEKHLKYTIS